MSSKLRIVREKLTGGRSYEDHIGGFCGAMGAFSYVIMIFVVRDWWDIQDAANDKRGFRIRMVPYF